MEYQKEWEPVIIPDTCLLKQTSVFTETDYEIKVWLPETYSRTTHKYPALYLLDGDYAFGMAVDIVQYLIYGGHIPPMIIISPGYGTKRLEEKGGNNKRTRDLNPFPSPDIPKPKGIYFLEFLLKELIPNVEKIYRIDSGNRTLSGFSYGSIFTLFTLFQHPEKFTRYIAIDGYNSVLNQVEDDFKRLNSSVPAELYMVSGQADMEGFYNKLVERKYNKLNLYHDRMDNKHFALPAVGLTNGLLKVFEKNHRG